LQKSPIKDDILQKRPIMLWILLTVATPYIQESGERQAVLQMTRVRIQQKRKKMESFRREALVSECVSSHSCSEEQDVVDLGGRGGAIFRETDIRMSMIY